jgi:twitching motility protein PilT
MSEEAVVPDFARRPERPIGLRRPSVSAALDASLDGEEPAGTEASGALLAWLREGRSLGASDLHLKPDVPPNLRLRGTLVPIEGAPVLDGRAISEMMKALVADKADWSEFMLGRHELDLGLEFPDVGRLRVNALFAEGQPAVAIRLVPSQIPDLADLGLPAITASLMRRQKGLWVFTGATGHGKTTTQAAILKTILAEQPRHVITLEDPVEYVHRHAKGLVSQREVGPGRDTESFEQGIVSALREDPDVILVGEMRDLETIRQALRAAETGHLVLTTLHTVDASLVVDRVVDVFPAAQQAQIRIQLSDVLLAVYAQQLVRTDRRPRDGQAAELSGRVAAIEVLLGPMAELTPARAIIRTAGPSALYTLMEQSVDAGCQTMERALVELVRAGKVSEETAREAAVRRDGFDRLMRATGAGR